MLININGQNYTSWEQLPPEVRQQLAATLPDTDKNGVPDMLEGNMSGLQGMIQSAIQSGGQSQVSPTFTSISVDGQQVSSLGQLPPEVQEMLRNTLGVFQPGSVAAPPPGTPGAVPVNAPWPVGAGQAPPPVQAPPGQPLQPGQVMLNGVPTVVGAEAPKKPWWKRIFGG